MSHILVVEDEHKINELIKDYFQSLGLEVYQSYNGFEAWEIFQKIKFDAAVIDIMLPGLDGYELARNIRKISDLPLIMLTARDSEGDKILGLEIGADDYMTKPFSVRELGARLRAALRRYCGELNPQFSKDIILVNQNIHLNKEKRIVLKDGINLPFTSAQFDILQLLMSFPGKVFTREEIIQRVSRGEFEGYERTIDVQIKNIRKVLEEEPSNPKILLTVWGVGYKIQEQGSV